MRKIIAGEFMSLDGVIESPDKWHFPYWSDAMGEAVGAQMSQSDAMLLGRVGWQEFAAYWPTADPSEAGEWIVNHMNTTPKYVVSTTLESADAWQNSTILRSLDEVRQLKEQPGNAIGISGSAKLVQSLIGADLLDELHLLVHPVLVGQGKKMFADDGDKQGMRLIDSKTIDNGVLYLVYGRASNE